jgi:hypothetical protein
LENSNDFDNNIDCPEGIISSPGGNISLMTSGYFDIR